MLGHSPTPRLHHIICIECGLLHFHGHIPFCAAGVVTPGIDVPRDAMSRDSGLNKSQVDRRPAESSIEIAGECGDPLRVRSGRRDSVPDLRCAIAASRLVLCCGSVGVVSIIAELPKKTTKNRRFSMRTSKNEFSEVQAHPVGRCAHSHWQRDDLNVLHAVHRAEFIAPIPLPAGG